MADVIKAFKIFFAVAWLILGYFYLVMLAYQAGYLFGLEGILRFLLANLVIFGWLDGIYKAINFLRKSI